MLFAMSSISKKTISLKDGRTCVLRNAEPNDAKDVINFKFQIADNSEYLTLLSDEIKDTRWKTKSRLKLELHDPNALHILAMDGENVIGTINTFGQSRRRLCHAVEFGIGILPPWQGTGLGFILISELLNWARANETITRVELHVHSENIGAIGLYKKLGFEEEGRRKNAIRYEDGSYMDDLLMAQLL